MSPVIAEDVNAARRELKTRQTAEKRERLAREAQRIANERAAKELEAERARRAAAADEAERELGLAEVRVTYNGVTFVFATGQREHVLRQTSLEGFRRLAALIAERHADGIKRARSAAINGAVAPALERLDYETLLESDQCLRPCSVRGLVRVETEIEPRQTD